MPFFDAPVKMVVTHRSKVAAGRIVAFHSRSSLLLSNLVNSRFVLTAHAGKQLNTSAFASGLTPHPRL